MEYRAHDDGIDSFGPMPAEFSSNCSTSTRLCVKRIAGRRPASYRTESDAPPEKVYSVWVNSAVWISKGGYGFSSLIIIRSSVMTLFRARMTRTNREA